MTCFCTRSCLLGGRMFLAQNRFFDNVNHTPDPHCSLLPLVTSISPEYRGHKTSHPDQCSNLKDFLHKLHIISLRCGGPQLKLLQEFRPREPCRSTPILPSDDFSCTHACSVNSLDYLWSLSARKLRTYRLFKMQSLAWAHSPAFHRDCRCSRRADTDSCSSASRKP